MFVLCGRCYVAVSISYWSTVHVRCMCCYCRYMLSLKFNPLKSHCLAIGKFASVSLPSMRLDSHPILWASSIKYLGVREFTLLVVGSCCLTLPQLNRNFVLPVTVFMLRLRVLMRRCIYPSKRAIVFLF